MFNTYYDYYSGYLFISYFSCSGIYPFKIVPNDSIQIIDMENFSGLKTLNVDVPVYSFVYYSPNKLLIIGSNNSVVFYNLSTENIIKQIPIYGIPVSVLLDYATGNVYASVENWLLSHFFPLIFNSQDGLVMT